MAHIVSYWKWLRSGVGPFGDLEEVGGRSISSAHCDESLFPEFLNRELETMNQGRAACLVWYMAQGYPVRGGHEAHILHYATEFMRRGYDVRVVVPDGLPGEPHLFMRLLSERGIPLRGLADEVRARRDLVSVLLGWAWLLWRRCTGRPSDIASFKSYVQGRLVARALRMAVENERPDVIHVFGRLADNLWDVLPADRVVFHHATDGMVDASWTAGELSRFKAFAEKVAVYVAPGKGVAENVKSEFGITREIVPVFTICPDEEGVSGGRSDNVGREVGGRERRDPVRFGVLCRMVKEKGLPALIEGVTLFGKRHANVRFLFAGAGPLSHEVRSFVENCGLPGIRYQEMFESPSDVLNQIDVFVHPSVSDAMPMAIAEALMCGKPCISTRVGGIPDLVRDGVEGLLLSSSATGASIADAMERIVGMDPLELTGFAERARKRYACCCRPEVVGDRMQDIYLRIKPAVAR